MVYRIAGVCVEAPVRVLPGSSFLWPAAGGADALEASFGNEKNGDAGHD